MVVKQAFSCDTDDCIHFDPQEEECGKGSVIIQDGCCCDYEKNRAAEKYYKVLGRFSTEYIQLSVHLDKHRLEDIACKYLSDLTGREITAFYDRREYYHWGLNIADTPLSNEELEKLFNAVGADDFDRDSNDFGEYPIMEINQGLAEKIMSDELPFVMSSSHADNEGVWFFGPPENKQVNILVTYPETDLVADCFRFTLKDGTNGDDLISYFHAALSELIGDVESDRLSRVDDIVARVVKKIGCKVSGISMSYEAEIM